MLEKNEKVYKTTRTEKYKRERMLEKEKVLYKTIHTEIKMGTS